MPNLPDHNRSGIRGPLTIPTDATRTPKKAPHLPLSVQSRASTDWSAPTCASPSKVVRKRGGVPSGARNPAEISMARRVRSARATSSSRSSRVRLPSSPQLQRLSEYDSARSIRKPGTDSGKSARAFLRPSSDVDRSNTVSDDRNKTSIPRTADDSAPILVPYGAGIWTFGDHLRHLAAHAGHIPLELDEFGRCVICIRRGFFTPNA